MADELFIDTSGFFALLVKPDDRHREASALMDSCRRSARLAVTTDYVLDETVTLLKMRGHGHLIEPFLDRTLESPACRIVWMDPGMFSTVRAYMAKRSDHAYSFTDCFSFSVMQREGLRDALTKDGHFGEAGFEALLA